MSLLAVEDLNTHFIARDLDNQVRIAKALNGVSFTLEIGRILGLVGETGAGKSLTAMSIMGLLQPPARLVGGRIMFEGVDLASMPPERLDALRGNRIGLVVQSDQKTRIRADSHPSSLSSDEGNLPKPAQGGAFLRPKINFPTRRFFSRSRPMR